MPKPIYIKKTNTTEFTNIFREFFSKLGVKGLSAGYGGNIPIGGYKGESEESPVPPEPNRYALVIGISIYINETVTIGDDTYRIPDLEYADNDAYDWKNYLEKLGYHVIF